MVTFENIFVTLFLFSWVVCGAMAWLVYSVAARGHAGLVLLPLSMATGILGGIAVPLLLRDDAWGVPLSLVAAFILPGVLLAIRWYSLGAAGQPVSGLPLPKEGAE